MLLIEVDVYRQANLGWCVADSDQLFIGDFNGDGQDDMLCHNRAGGYKWIVLALPDGPFIGDFLVRIC